MVVVFHLTFQIGFDCFLKLWGPWCMKWLVPSLCSRLLARDDWSMRYQKQKRGRWRYLWMARMCSLSQSKGLLEHSMWNCSRRCRTACTKIEGLDLCNTFYQQIGFIWRKCLASWTNMLQPLSLLQTHYRSILTGLQVLSRPAMNICWNCFRCEWQWRRWSR